MRCSIRSTSTMDLDYTGPLNSGRSDTAYWDAVIYNWNCSQIHFYEIEVTFMDGTTHNDIQRLLVYVIVCYIK